MVVINADFFARIGMVLKRRDFLQSCYCCNAVIFMTELALWMIWLKKNSLSGSKNIYQ
jgi:hypothetical protein